MLPYQIQQKSNIMNSPKLSWQSTSKITIRRGGGDSYFKHPSKKPLSSLRWPHYDLQASDHSFCNCWLDYITRVYRGQLRPSQGLTPFSYKCLTKPVRFLTKSQKLTFKTLSFQSPLFFLSFLNEHKYTLPRILRDSSSIAKHFKTFIPSLRWS